MKTLPSPIPKRHHPHTLTLLVTLLLVVSMNSSPAADPRLISWLTDYSGTYARLFESDADLAQGISKTTWTRGSITQARPAYRGVSALFSSSDWVYLKTTGLGSHVMGPWYLDTQRTRLFPNLPRNTATLYRIPRNPTAPAVKQLTGLGAIGYFIDGVAMFDGRDAFYWNGTGEVGGGTGLWNRDAYVNESVTFDPANAHQPRNGMYHYHANPIALRHLVHDHVDYDPDSGRYAESSIPPRHSPILGWVRDGYPVYGPYGYSNLLDTNSSVRRMISGYVLRNGENSTDDLTDLGRISLPQWAARAYDRTSTLNANEYGPDVSTQYPLGRYMEDKDFLGDLGKTQGVDFDLDEFNGRFCKTPEFPGGTYAYFVCIDAQGAPVFPYNIGRSYYGNPTGNRVTSINEDVTTNFVGGANSTLILEEPSLHPTQATVTLMWSSVDGGTYRIESSTQVSEWTTRETELDSLGVTSQTTLDRTEPNEFFRVVRTGLADYDNSGE